jgi:hypothetical protein
VPGKGAGWPAPVADANEIGGAGGESGFHGQATIGAAFQHLLEICARIDHGPIPLLLRD